MEAEPQAPLPPEHPLLDMSQAMSALLLELATMPRRSEHWERALQPGETVGRFELVREIGRGGFGIVYEARDRELGRSVAFKAVRPGRGLDAGAAELLLREAEAIARLSHPNLVTLHDVGRCEQGPYLVLELLRGETLGEALHRGPLSVREALRVGTEVARGLAHAHAAGVTHRDLKPSNVFLCAGGHVKVLDFGMAHAFGRERILGGTAAYMAPEQWGDGSEDERTDVFALGVMLYQMVRGEVPLPEGGKRLRAEAVPRLSLPECPALGNLVERMLQPDPADRPRDAAEVLSALLAFHEVIRVGQDVTARFALSPRRRPRRPWVAVAAATAVVLLAAGAVALQLLRPAPPPALATPSVAVLPFTVLSAAPDDASLAAGIHAEVITRLTQIGGVRVVGGSSVQGYAPGKPRDLAAIARQLGVTAVAEGTVQRVGDRLRVQAQLLDPASRTQRWAERFDRRADDLLALQGDVALEIARALGARLSSAELQRVERAPTRDPVAHELFLRGRYFWDRSSDDADRRRSHELLAAAVARDPDFALAHAWLAVLDTELANVGEAGYPFERACRSARLHAERALALDADLPQAHGAVAEVRWACDGNSAGALAEYEIQARLAPGDGVARVNVGYTRMALGQWGPALGDLRQALQLDPRSYFVAILVADRMIQLRHFDEAEVACQRAMELSPGDVRAPTTCALIPYFRAGDLGPARAALDQVLQQWSASNQAVTGAVDLLYLLPDRTLELAQAGRLPDPVSSAAPFLPRALLTAAAHAALGHAAQARADYASVVEPLERRVAEMRHQEDRPALGVQLLWLARAHAGVGRADEAVREVHEGVDLLADVPMKSLALGDVAEVLTAVGRRDEAVSMLAEALDAPAGTLTPSALRATPSLAGLRGYPPFEALVSARLAGR